MGDSKGYTLTEILIALALLGIILSIAVPKISSGLLNVKVKHAKADLLGIRSSLRRLIADRGDTTRAMRDLGYGTE